jgi:hypothetical protein
MNTYYLWLAVGLSDACLKAPTRKLLLLAASGNGVSDLYTVEEAADKPIHLQKATAMKINKEDLPIAMEAPGTVMRNAAGFGGMAVAFNQVPQGTYLRPLLQGLSNDSCHCPHWGYILQGAIRIFYDDKLEEVSREGDLFYWPTGHTAVVEEDVKLVEFSPEWEFREVMEHIGRKMADAGK